MTENAKCTADETVRPQVQRVPSPRIFHGEEPHWDPQTQSLYYVDIHANEDYNSSLLRYDYRKNRVFSASVDGARTLVFVLPIACSKDQFLVGIDKTLVIVKWDGRSSKATTVQRLFELDSKVSGVIINDVKTDERGRFYGGTRILKDGKPCAGCVEPISSFYSYESGKCLKKIFGNVTFSNGLTWVRKTRKFYYIDSCTYDIKEFDYNARTANGQRIFSSIMRNGTKPDYVLDGMTNDLDGNLYVAIFGGSRIIKLNPRTGEILTEIKLPAKQVTSLAFGGPNLDILYVTTANRDAKQPKGAGYLYKVTGLNARGYPGVRFGLDQSCMKQKQNIMRNKKLSFIPLA